MTTRQAAVASSRGPAFVTLGCVALACAAVAAVLAQAGANGLIVAAGALAIAAVLVLARRRTAALLVLLVLSLQFLFHKSFGPVNTEIHSGANAIFINNISALLVVLYALWIVEGDAVRDIRLAVRRPMFWIPLAAIALALPSVLFAQDLYLAVAELIRMLAMYLLFVCVALRLRSRDDVLAVVGALFVVAATQAVVATLQWKTGSSLGLELLGEQDTLGVRMLDDGSVDRPSGTVVHPIFLAALVAPIGMIALALSFDAARAVWRRVSLAAAGVAFLPLILAQARASLIAAACAVAALVACSLATRRLRWTPVLVALLISGTIGLLFAEEIGNRIEENFATDHFETEVEARVQLNDVALAMIADHPLAGVGLNNFETVEPEYDRYGLLFAGNPVHNIYLLVAAETGVLGLIGFLATLGAVALSAVRAARARDRALRAIGAGIAASLLFFLVEELLSFALRQEMPLALFWILAGVAVAIARIDRAAGDAGVA